MLIPAQAPASSPDGRGSVVDNLAQRKQPPPLAPRPVSCLLLTLPLLFFSFSLSSCVFLLVLDLRFQWHEGIGAQQRVAWAAAAWCGWCRRRTALACLVMAALRGWLWWAQCGTGRADPLPPESVPSRLLPTPGVVALR
jgi:hypothetical protein